MKLQMLKMVKDLNLNTDRTQNARSILNELNSAWNPDGDSSKVFEVFDNWVIDVKDDVWLEISEIRTEIRDIFARLDCDSKLMNEDLNDMDWESKEMQKVVTRMDQYVSNFEMIMGHNQR